MRLRASRTYLRVLTRFWCKQEWGSLTRLLAWNYGKHFEWQRVAAGSSFLNAVPRGEGRRSQLDDQRRRRPGSGQLPSLRRAIDSPPQQLCAALEGPSSTGTTGGIDRASRPLALPQSRLPATDLLPTPA